LTEFLVREHSPLTLDKIMPIAGAETPRERAGGAAFDFELDRLPARLSTRESGARNPAC
jgi:hypothetical protein